MRDGRLLELGEGTGEASLLLARVDASDDGAPSSENCSEKRSVLKSAMKGAGGNRRGNRLFCSSRFTSYFQDLGSNASNDDGQVCSSSRAVRSTSEAAVVILAEPAHFSQRS